MQRSLHGQVLIEARRDKSKAPEKLMTIPALAKTTLPAQKKEIRKWQLRRKRPQGCSNSESEDPGQGG